MCHGRKVSYTVEVQSLAGQLHSLHYRKIFTLGSVSMLILYRDQSLKAVLNLVQYNYYVESLDNFTQCNTYFRKRVSLS